MLRILLVLCFLFIPLRADALECSKHKDAVLALAKNGYMWLATAITDQMMVMQFYIGKNGDWVMLMVDHDMKACVIAHGTQWMFPMERAI